MIEHKVSNFPLSTSTLINCSLLNLQIFCAFSSQFQWLKLAYFFMYKSVAVKIQIYCRKSGEALVCIPPYLQGFIPLFHSTALAFCVSMAGVLCLILYSVEDVLNQRRRPRRQSRSEIIYSSALYGLSGP